MIPVRCVRTVLLSIGLGVVGLAVGCTRLASPPAPSAFITQGVIPLVRQAATESGGIEWQQRSSSAGSGSGNGRMQAHADEVGTLHGPEANLDKFLATLRSRMLEAARQGGATPEEVRDVGGDGGARGFRFGYTTGTGAHGVAVVEVHPVEPAKGMPAYQLKVHVEESFP